MDEETLFPTQAGTPQGGVASPLLANIALHGLETAITTAFPPTKVVNGRRVNPWRPIVIRYADLCRHRHKSAYADYRIMPTPVG